MLCYYPDVLYLVISCYFEGLPSPDGTQGLVLFSWNYTVQTNTLLPSHKRFEPEETGFSQKLHITEVKKPNWVSGFYHKSHVTKLKSNLFSTSEFSLSHQYTYEQC